ncbi:hypothetical protein CJT61_30900, partial [Pseudomonas aeruginosa]
MTDREKAGQPPRFSWGGALCRRMFAVRFQAEQGNRMTPESVLELYVPNAAGNLVPLSAFVSVKWEEGPV